MTPDVLRRRINVCKEKLGDACPADDFERTMQMSPRTSVSPAVAAEANRFELTLKAARIPAVLSDALWDVWVDNPGRAQGLVARFKDSGATPAVRLKEAPGMTTIEVPTELASEIAACRAQWGDLPFAQMLRQARGGASGGAGGTLGDTEKAPTATTKAQQLTPIQQAARATMPELYKEPKR